MSAINETLINCPDDLTIRVDHDCGAQVCSFEDSEVTNWEIERYAKLFAAAPDYQSATAYLILSSTIKGGYWDQDTIEWAKSLMAHEKRTGAEIVRAAIAKATGKESA